MCFHPKLIKLHLVLYKILFAGAAVFVFKAWRCSSYCVGLSCLTDTKCGGFHLYISMRVNALRNSFYIVKTPDSGAHIILQGPTYKISYFTFLRSILGFHMRKCVTQVPGPHAIHQ